MSIGLYGANGETYSLNSQASEVLNYLGWGLKEKYGVYGPMSLEDCRILARILRNKANVLTNNGPKRILRYLNLKIHFNSGWDYMNKPLTKVLINEISAFLETSGGLISEEEYDSRFGEE